MKKTALTPIVGRMDHAAASQKFSMPPWYAAGRGLDSSCTIADSRKSIHIGLIGPRGETQPSTLA